MPNPAGWQRHDGIRMGKNRLATGCWTPANRWCQLIPRQSMRLEPGYRSATDMW